MMSTETDEAPGLPPGVKQQLDSNLSELRRLSDRAERADLAGLWPTLTPKQKDARVAQALGLRIWSYTGMRGYLNLGDQLIMNGTPGEPLSGWWEELPWERFDERRLCASEDDETLAAYSSEWEDAGPLLEEMIAADLDVALMLDDSGRTRVDVCRPGADRFISQESGETLPDAIALAYVLAKRASSPAPLGEE